MKSIAGDYGDIGVNVRHSHGTGDAQGTLSVPLFKEFGLRGEAQVAQAQLDTQQAQMSDLNAQVDADVRDSLLDIASAQKQVEVSRSSVDLANEALSEAQQRYANGVSDNLAVSQAQQSVAQANDQYVPASTGQRRQADSGACPGSGAELQEISGREVDVADTTTTTVRRRADESTEVAQPRSRRRGIIFVVVVVLVLVALGFWWHSTYYEDTDDAQINGHLIQISSRIAGQVIKVDVDENQVVKAGDAIAELDPRDLPGCCGERAGRSGQRAGSGRRGEGECADHDSQHGQQPEFGRRGRERGARLRFRRRSSKWQAAQAAGDPGRGEQR